MGTFIGHLLPGAIFLIIGLHWTYGIARRAFKCRNRKRVFYNTVTYPLPMLCERFKWPMEAAFKLLVTSVGIIGELIFSLPQAPALKINFYQHMTMYGFFWVSGVVDILSSYKQVPRGLDHLTMGVSFLAEAILFMHHSHGCDPLHTHVHTFIIYVDFACSLVCLMELVIRNSPLMALTKSFVVCVQGTWFIHVGFMLYPILGLPHWDSEADENLMIASLMFTWHVLGVAVVMALLCLLAYRLNGKHGGSTGEEDYERLISHSLSAEEDG